MGDGWKRARDAVLATQLRWWTVSDGLHWWLQLQPGAEVRGEVEYVMKGSENDGWYAYVPARDTCRTLDGTKFASCRAAKLAVRRAVKG